MEDRKLKWVLSGDWYQWEGKRYRKGMKEGEMVGILCTHV
jgi:hypothetical protein